MRENTPTARLDATSTPRPSDAAQVRAALHQVGSILPQDAQTVRLELQNGAAVILSEGIGACLLPPQLADGLAVLVYQWGRPDEAAYAVPASLLPELLPYFPTTGD